MKIAKTHQSLSASLKKMMAEKRRWDLKKSKCIERLKEDYFLQSHKFPIFTMADGVLLAIKPGEPYLIPSGAGKVAEVFCRSAVKNAEKTYDSFGKEDVMDIFTEANAKVEKYNARRNRTKKTVNYFNIDYFSATVAFALVKNSELFWGAIGDTKIFLEDKNGKVEFSSSDRVEEIERITAKKFPNPKPQQKKIFQQKYYRNKIGPDGKLIGYGVIDGEPEALRYVESGKAKIKKGDQLFIFTDGFTPYFKFPEFKKIFAKWSDNIEKEISEFIKDYIFANTPKDPEKQYRFLYKYAAEKSLIAIKL